MEEPMDIAVSVWRFKNDPEFRERTKALAGVAVSFHKQQALYLLELCQGSDPSDFYEEIQTFQPSSYVIAELVALAKRSQAKDAGRAGAAGRHTENRAIKQDVFAWLDANPPKPRGKSAAATAIAGKVAPVVFTTALGWVNEWEKLRSTGTT